MRVVVDLEGSDSDALLAFVAALARTCGQHELWVAPGDEDSALAVRAVLAGLVAPTRIVAVAPPGPRLARAALRAWTLAALNPDAILHANWPSVTFGAASHVLLLPPGAPARAGVSAIVAQPALVQQAWDALACTPAPALLPRRRLAFVCPLPPEPTGIADYAVQLLPAMLDYFDIDLIVHQEKVILPPSLQCMPLRDVAWFDANAHLFDQIMYQFGNSAYHAHMFAMLERHPGVVVLHEFFLSGVIALLQVTGAVPRAWSDALFHSHGYDAVCASLGSAQQSETIKAYPCSLKVLQRATNVIVHSSQARTLAQRWYGALATDKWTVVPLPRAAPALLARAAARHALGIPDATFLACSFGYVTPTKLVDRLLAAWQSSRLYGEPACQLVLVGANHEGPYGAAIAATIAAAGGRIQILGWTSEERYRLYLGAADLAIQLRSGSRGETSAAALDCMNAGLATIVNANGSMADLPDGAVVLLEDQFTDEALRVALERMHSDKPLRVSVGARAAALLEAQFRPAACARQYRDALDRAWRAPQEHDLFAALPAALWRDDLALQHTAEAIAASPIFDAPRQLMIDASAGLGPADLATVLRAHLPGWRIELVRLEPTSDGPRYRYARALAAQLLHISPPAPDCLPDWQAGDILLGACRDAASAAHAGLLANLRGRGVEVVCLARADDAGGGTPLPVRADRVLCTSAQVYATLAPAAAAAGAQLVLMPHTAAQDV